MTFIPLPGVGQPTDAIASSPTQASATLVALARLAASHAATLADTVVTGKQLIGGARDKWRDDFHTKDTTKWTFTENADDVVVVDGNAQGSSFLRIVKNSLVRNTLTEMLGKASNSLPVRYGHAFSLSQRDHGTLHAVDVVEVDASGAVVLDESGVNALIMPDSTFALTGAPSATVTSNIVKVYVPGGHNFTYDQLVVLSGCADTRINAVLRIADVPSKYMFTAALTLANGAYSVAGGSVSRLNVCAGARNIASMIFLNDGNGAPGSANALYFVKGEGSPGLLSGQTNFGTSYTDAVIPSAKSFAINIQARFVTDIMANLDAVRFQTQGTDSSSLGANGKRSQNILNPARTYAPRIRSYRLPNALTPVEVVSAVKTASATATVTTLTPHGMVTGGYARGYGMRDQTNWANVTTEAAITRIDDYNFTMTWGASATGTVYGGFILPCHTAAAVSGALTHVVQSLCWRDGKAYVGLSSGYGGSIGDIVRLVGLRNVAGGAPANYSGRFRVVAVNPLIVGNSPTFLAGTTSSNATITLADTSFVSTGCLITGTGVGTNAIVNAITPGVSLTMSANSTATGSVEIFMTGFVLEPLDFTAPADTQYTTAAGYLSGAIFREAEIRLNSFKCLDYTRTPVEVVGGQNTFDDQQSPSVYLRNPTSSTVTQGTRATVGSGWYVEPDNLLVADIASAAITSTTTSSAVTPTPVGGAAEFNFQVTAVSGTSPTLDVAVEESDDSGTNWERIYEFPRVTTNGTYRSPRIPLRGNRIRYVRTLTGTTPSFTMVLNRITHQMVDPPVVRQIVDRTVVLTTGNSVTPSLNTNGANNVQLVLNVGAITTTAPQVQLEGSDDNGATWYVIGAPLVAVASSTVQLTVLNIQADRVRGRVSTAGVGVTAGFTLIKVWGRS